MFEVTRLWAITRKCTAVLRATLLVLGESLLMAQLQQETGSPQTAAAKTPPDQLDSLVARPLSPLSRCRLGYYAVPHEASLFPNPCFASSAFLSLIFQRSSEVVVFTDDTG
jgi:hypothetical protein